MTASGTQLAGELFLYNEDFGYAAFEAGGRGESSRALVVIPGLTDGLLSLRYLPALVAALNEAAPPSRRWRVVQPVLSSSYCGWGLGSLAEDVAEIDRLLDFLEARRGVAEVAILGHSTGCQDVVRYLADGRRKDMVRAAVLQAPVSDREALPLTFEGRPEEFEEQLNRYRTLAATMIKEHRGDEVMPRAACLLLGPPHAVTAYRFDSLTGRLTDDDMFSSDLSDEELRGRLGHIAVPTLVAASLDDEYVPRAVDGRALAARMAAATAAGAAGAATVLCLEEGGHGLRVAGAPARFIAAVLELLGALDGPAPPAPRVSWEPAVAGRLRAMAADSPSGRPLMVALAGVPGAGKSTGAGTLARMLGPGCLIVPMDGFHVPLAALRAQPNAEDLVYRRGAPDTFDPGALRARLAEARGDAAGAPEVVWFPAFEHAVGDPVEAKICFDRAKHNVIIVEGLYLLHDGDGWEGLAAMFDYSIFMDASIDECIDRLKERNKVIPGYTPEQIEARCDAVDRQNALIVQRSAGRADARVRSAAAP